MYPGKTKNGGWQNRVYTKMDRKANRGLVSEAVAYAGGSQCGAERTARATTGEQSGVDSVSTTSAGGVWRKRAKERGRAADMAVSCRAVRSPYRVIWPGRVSMARTWIGADHEGQGDRFSGEILMA